MNQFTAIKWNEGNFYDLSGTSPNYWGVFANQTDTSLYDFIFKPYDWSCGSKLRVQLEDTKTGKIEYDSTYLRDDLRYLYLTKYTKYPEHLIIRLNLENHTNLLPSESMTPFFKLKILAIDNNGKSTLVYGKGYDKLFMFNNETYRK